jgi:DNA-binding GntR family transcriptional regulator
MQPSNIPSVITHVPSQIAQNIRPLDRAQVNGSLHDEIYLALRHALIVGDVVPGQAFSARTLAEQFGTSLIPVRDALRRLFAEHALAVLQNRSFYVPKMSRQRFQELLQVRLNLESMLTRRAAEAMTPETLRELEAINAEMQDAVPANEVRRYLIANHRFHFTIYAAASSLAIFPIVESLWMQVGPFLNGVFTQAGTKSARDNHTQVLKALRRGDAIAAADAIAKDLGDAADVILANAEFVVDEEGASGRAKAGRKRTEELR